MSTNFTGVTFMQQNASPADDAIIHRAFLPDGILTGCRLSYVGSTLTMEPGQLLLCGRQIRHPSRQNWRIADSTTGFARVLMTIDLTKSATALAFEQVNADVEYASAADGFSSLTQSDINASGTKYQQVLCVVSLSPGGISGIINRLGETVSAAAAWNRSQIVVTAPAGSTVYITSGSGVRKYAAEKSGVWIFSGCDAGIWTVYAAGGSQSGSFAVDIQQETPLLQYHVTVFEDYTMELAAASGLNFTVAAGTTRPERPRNNTIWVNTSSEIAYTVISAERPELAGNGTLWLGTSAFSQPEFAATTDKNVYIPLRIRTAQICRTGPALLEGREWSFDLPVEIYQDGQWYIASDATFLYDAGDQWTAITGGWKSYAYACADLPNLYAVNPTTTFGTASITMSMAKGSSASGARSGSLFSENEIDRVEATRLYIRTNALAKSDTGMVAIGISTTKASNFNAIAYAEITETGETVLDISNAPDTFYVFVAVIKDNSDSVATSVTFDRIWMI